MKKRQKLAVSSQQPELKNINAAIAATRENIQRTEEQLRHSHAKLHNQLAEFHRAVIRITDGLNED